jgi:hypothetical protein
MVFVGQAFQPAGIGFLHGRLESLPHIENPGSAASGDSEIIPGFTTEL